ncbi:MAG: aldo/keto reductase [Methylomonas sp.]
MQTPQIIYGTAWKKDRTAELVEQAIGFGFRGVDTACQPKHYHEAGVGAGVAAACRRNGLQRGDLYLQSKFTPVDGHDPQQIPYDKHAAPGLQVRQSFQKSLRNLQTDYLDGLILHSPLADRRQLLEVWQAMERIVDDGGVRRLGVSNCYDLTLLKELYQSARIKPAIIQNRFYAASGYDIGIRRFCAEHGLIYQSFWTLTANPHILAHDKIGALAKKYLCGPAQIFFRYLTQIGITPLTGTCSARHMREDLAIFEFELDPEECQEITDVMLP